MTKLVTLLASILTFGKLYAQTPLDKTEKKAPAISRPSVALGYLFKSKILILDPKDNSIKFNLQNEDAMSILNDLNEQGLLSEEFSARGPWCD